jgi:tRNA(fMet)-specific endonuclease VapC
VILLLDTNTCIYLIKQHPPEVLRKFNEYTVGDIGISSITAAELAFGVQKSQRPEENRRALQQFLLPLTVAHFDENAAAAYGHIRAQLEKRGTSIGPLDTLIAAHALSLDLTLVTNNVREFERVPDLEVENWVVA